MVSQYDDSIFDRITQENMDEIDNYYIDNLKTEITQEVSMHQNQKTIDGTSGFRYAIKKSYKSFTAEG